MPTVELITQSVVALVSALIGGVLAIYASIKVMRETSAGLETTEIRRQKIDCITAIGGLRFVISEGNDSLPVDYKARVMFEMNRIPILWCDDAEVLKHLRDFYAERTNERLIALIRVMGKTTKLPIGNLSDADIRSIFLMTITPPPNVTDISPQVFSDNMIHVRGLVYDSGKVGVALDSYFPNGSKQTTLLETGLAHSIGCGLIETALIGHEVTATLQSRPGTVFDPVTGIADYGDRIKRRLHLNGSTARIQTGDRP